MNEPPVEERKTSEFVHDLTGTTVGRFAIRSKLGAGGMGEVYRAEDSVLKRPVALKRMAPRLGTDPQFRQRFLREAQNASHLTDPHIAAVYDVLEHQDEIFLVMEYIEGQTLRQRLREPLALEPFFEMAIQCAQALVAAHEKNLVHRDIKPENIMLTPAGHVKILDFGVAKRLPVLDETSPTGSLGSAAGSLSGTPAYMAPEVLLEKDPDPRADIFSLGVVFYEALAGRHPFLSDSFVATSDHILHVEPPPITQISPHVPLELERIVSRMLAKDREARYANAAELLADLEAARSVEMPKPRWLRDLAGKDFLLRAAALVILLAAIATGLLYFRRPLERWTGRSPIPEQKNLVVVPFQALGGAAENQVYSDGLTETLTAKLAQLTATHSLQVPPASEVRQRHIASVESARKEFGANLVLEGSLLRSGNQVRVNFSLVDSTSKRQLRAETITAGAGDPFALQDQVVEAAVRMLELELKPAEQQTLGTHGTQVARAFDLYLQGRGYLQNYEKKENVERALDIFKQALALDPNYALAYAGLGEAYWKKYDFTKEAATVEAARTACDRAEKLDANLAAAHICLGTLSNGTGQYEQGVAEFQRALETEPTSDDAYRGLAEAYQRLNKPGEAEKTYRRAIALRPQYWAGFNDLGIFYYRHSRYADAAQMFQKVVELSPDNPWGYSNLGAMYHFLGRSQEAIRAYQKSMDLSPNYGAASNLGTLLFFYEHKYVKAAQAFEQALALNDKDYLVWGNLGEAYLRAQQPEKSRGAYQRAVPLAEQALKINPRDAKVMASLAGYYASLKEAARARELLEKALRLGPNDAGLLFKAGGIYEDLGKRDQALTCLRRAIAAGYSREEIDRSPSLASLRKDPRFKAILKKR